MKKKINKIIFLKKVINEKKYNYIHRRRFSYDSSSLLLFY